MINQYFSAIKPVLSGLIALIMLQAAYACAAPLKLALVLSEQGSVYQVYSSELSQLLADKDIALSIVESNQALPEAELFVAAGMKASNKVAQSKPAAMLAVLVTKEGVAKLREDFPTLGKSGDSIFSAIYLDQPFKRQLDLIAAVLPNARTIGVIYTTQPAELSALRKMSAAREFDLNERSVSSASSMHASLQDLLISSDVLLALPDSEIYNSSTIRNILLATYRSKVPLIGFSPGYVKAGALCAVFSTPEQIAAQSFSVIKEYAEARRLAAPQYTKAFEIAINEQVARSLGLSLKNITQIRSEIGALP